MLLTPLPIVTLVRPVQAANALSAMLVTLSGIVMLVTMLFQRNARDPMEVTGRPLIVLGMFTAPPEHVYPVMVIVPLLVVQVKQDSMDGGPERMR
jgi:hypothetical protein